MTGRFLLDTNIIIALFASEASVTQSLQEVAGVFVPSIAVGELYYGAYKSGRIKENLSRVATFAARSVVLACDVDTARFYGQLKDSLREKGRPIPENDIWIAALAVQHGLVLVSRDAHFSEVPDLVLETW